MLNIYKSWYSKLHSEEKLRINNLLYGKKEPCVTFLINSLSPLLYSYWEWPLKWEIFVFYLTTYILPVSTCMFSVSDPGYTWASCSSSANSIQFDAILEKKNKLKIINKQYKKQKQWYQLGYILKLYPVELINL